MNLTAGAVVAALVSSACCIGPPLFAALGSGALAAASTKLDTLRPLALALSVAIMGLAFYRAYSVSSTNCSDGSCEPAAARRSRIIVWIAAIAVGLLAAFPYYSEYLF